MSLNITSGNVVNANKGQARFFRRTQFVLVLWGVLLVAGGFLHNSNGKSWGATTLFFMWLGLALFGLFVTYLVQPLLLNSGMLSLWSGIIVIGLLITWAAIFPFNIYSHSSYGGSYIATLWHSLFMLGYIIIGYYMDRRFWFLALWEALVAVVMLLISLDVLDMDFLSSNSGLTFGLSAAIGLFVAALPIWKQRNHI